MATDIIISAFATPPQSRARAIAQPTNLFSHAPVVLDVNGIGSDVFMGPSDTEKKPREPWGGSPFSREAAMYRAKGDGSVLQGILRTKARGIEPRRICAIGFSAGGTFIKNLVESEQDRSALDMVMMLDALNLPKAWNGDQIPSTLTGYANFGANALLAGVRAARGTDNKDPFLGPTFITSHTNIKQSSALEAQVANTTLASEWVFNASLDVLRGWQESGHVELGGIKTINVDWAQMTQSLPAGAFPVTIGDRPDSAGNRPWATTPGPTKTWKEMPFPNVRVAAGNFYDFDYGGNVAADHVFEAWHVQGALWRTFLIPRWNAEFNSPYAVAGLGDWSTCCPGRGGNLLPPGYFDTGMSTLKLAAIGALGFLAGKSIVELL